MAQRQKVEHGIPPTYDANSRVLVLGTMPSPASREGGYNYGHPRNRFWQVLAQLAGEPVPTTNERKRDFCLRHHIALWDVLAECEIAGASDASIANAKPNDLSLIFEAAPIEAVFCTGAKAHELYRRLCEPTCGVPAVRLPSTSPANAACGMERLLAEYAAIFEHTHEYEPPVLDVPDVVALEQAIAAAGTPLSELMDRAGTAVARRVRQVIDEVAGGGYPAWARDLGEYTRRVVLEPQATRPVVTIFCGNGNNGGDGWVAAALLAREGVPVCVFTARMPDQLKAQPARDAAIAALDELRGCGARVVRAADDAAFDEEGRVRAPLVVLDDGTVDGRLAFARSIVLQSWVVVDAMMGTGSSGAPRDPFLHWVIASNLLLAGHARLAVDVPSGVSAQTGDSSTPRFLADETLTMMVRKPGLTAPECGRVQVAPLAYLEPFLARG